MTPADQTAFPVRETLDDLASFAATPLAAGPAHKDADPWLAGVVRQLVHAAIGVAIAVAVWTTIINWFTRHIQQELAKVPPVKFEAKPLEFQEFDVDGFHRALGIQPQE